MSDSPTLWDAVAADHERLMEPLDGPGQARRSDPDTSHQAARLVKARAGTARVRLLEAHASEPDGLTDEEAAVLAGLSLASEYATRCSELTRMRVLEVTTETRRGISGAQREVRRITGFGRVILAERRAQT